MTETTSPHHEAEHSAESGFHVHWDRTSLFLVGVVSLAVAVVTALCALAGLPTAGAAGWALSVTVAAVVGLRILAVRDQREADAAADRDEDAAPRAEEDLDTQDIPVVADPERDRRTFAALEAFEQDLAPAPAAPAASYRPVPRVPLEGIVIPSVPRPTYLDAPEVERELPEPLAAEPAPRSTARLNAPAPAAAEEPVREDAEQDLAALDLDNVLARRRAS